MLPIVSINCCIISLGFFLIHSEANLWVSSIRGPFHICIFHVQLQTFCSGLISSDSFDRLKLQIPWLRLEHHCQGTLVESIQ